MRESTQKNQSVEGDFKSVLEENKASILRICRIYATSLYETEDLYQEVVLQIWKSLSSFNQKSAISTWVYRIALNVCLKAQRAQEKEKNRIRLDSIEIKLSESPEDENELLLTALRSCLQTLKNADKSIMVLYLEDLPYREISEITGLSENHVAVKMKRIRQQLEKCISPKIL